jgi:hypothetical protein
MKKKIVMVALLAFMVVLMLPLAAAAQGVTIDPEVLKKILNLSFLPFGIGGVIGLTELVKRWFWPNEATRPKWSGYAVSIALSIIASGVFFLFFAPPFVLATFALYTFVTALAANGLYKAF